MITHYDMAGYEMIVEPDEYVASDRATLPIDPVATPRLISVTEALAVEPHRITLPVSLIAIDAEAFLDAQR